MWSLPFWAAEESAEWMFDCMPIFRLNDPKLQSYLEELAKETAANWPPLSDEATAKLAQLLSPPIGRSTSRDNRNLPDTGLSVDDRQPSRGRGTG